MKHALEARLRTTSVTALAKELGVSYNVLHKILQGKTVRSATLQRVHNALYPSTRQLAQELYPIVMSHLITANKPHLARRSPEQFEQLVQKTLAEAVMRVFYDEEYL